MSGMSSSPSETAPSQASPLPPIAGVGRPLLNAPAAPRVPIFSAEAWAPLKVPLFASLYIATSIAQVGTWVREAGGPWLMKLLTDGRHDQPAMVAKVLLFSNLPICLFSVFAGALADVLDRRKLLLATQIWMMIASASLGIMTWEGAVSPGSLMFMTFLLGVGTAAAGPALQALLPELVPRADLPLAINLNSVALNVARAMGPALFILVIAVVPGRSGVGTSFLVTAISFIPAIVILQRWKRPPQRAAVHGEGIRSAIRAGFVYNLHSPANRAILFRVLTFIVPAVVMWSQVPIIATRQLGLDQHWAEKGSALLFAFVGVGAVFGVLIMPGLQKRYRIDPVVNVCIACFASGLILLSFVHHLWIAAFIMVFLGVNWVIIPTNFNTATQTSVPLWVKGRSISFYLTVLFGSFTIGALVWGNVTTATSISTSLLVGGLSMGSMLVLAPFFPLTLNEGIDLSPAFRPGEAPPPLTALATRLTPPPAASTDSVTGATAPTTSPATGGPAQSALRYEPGPGTNEAQNVIVEYRIDSSRSDKFLEAAARVGRMRRRNGASHWQVRRAVEQSAAPIAAAAGRTHLYVESFRYGSAAELNRQAGRMTKADLAALEAVAAFHSAAEAPAAHLVAESDSPFDPPASARLRVMFVRSIDRTLDEIGNMMDRVTRQRPQGGPWA